MPILAQPDIPLNDRLPALIELISGADEELAAASQDIDQLEIAYARLEENQTALLNLPVEARQLLPLLDRFLPLGAAGLAFAPLLPKALGHSRPQTYLIIAQNEDERRATGGFIR